MCEYFGPKITNVFTSDIPDQNDLIKAQHEDAALMAIKEILENGMEPDFRDKRIAPFRTVWRRLVIAEKLVKMKMENGAIPVLPESQVPVVLRHIHGAPFASHYGISKCYYKLRGKFYDTRI